MKWHENRALAWLALVLCVAVSLFALGGLGLQKARNNALSLFTDGADPSQPVRHSMDAYLNAAAESARIMASEAALLGTDATVCDSVSAPAAVLGDSGAKQADRREALSALETAVDALYNAAFTDDKSAFAPFKLAYDDFWGDVDLIRHDSYPAAARAYNQQIRSFPGSLVARLIGCGALETFGG